MDVQASLPLAEELAAVAAHASGLLLSEKTVAETLKLITEAAKLSFPESVGAGVTLIDNNARKTSMASSDDVVEKADAMQYALEEGPCLTAWATGETVVVDDVATDPRWPRWSRRVASLGVTASISVPMTSGGESFGAVKVYSNQAWAFNSTARRILELLVAQAAVLVEHAQSAEGAKRLSEELQHALRSRDLIGMAKGLIMQRRGVAEGEAMQLLMKLAVADRATLRETAVRLVEAAGSPET